MPYFHTTCTEDEMRIRRNIYAHEIKNFDFQIIGNEDSRSHYPYAARSTSMYHDIECWISENLVDGETAYIKTFYHYDCDKVIGVRFHDACFQTEKHREKFNDYCGLASTIAPTAFLAVSQAGR